MFIYITRQSLSNLYTREKSDEGQKKGHYRDVSFQGRVVHGLQPHVPGVHIGHPRTVAVVAHDLADPVLLVHEAVPRGHHIHDVAEQSLIHRQTQLIVANKGVFEFRHAAVDIVQRKGSIVEKSR